MDSFDTLKLNRDFRRLYHKGKNFVHPALVTYVLPNRYNVNRIGITAGKKIGNAVSRNRAKRVITAAFRQCEPYIGKGYDFVFVARSRTGTYGSRAVFDAMTEQFQKLGIWDVNYENVTDKTR